MRRLLRHDGIEGPRLHDRQIRVDARHDARYRREYRLGR